MVKKQAAKKTNKEKKTTSKEYISNDKLIVIGIIGIVIVFGVLIFFMNQKPKEVLPVNTNTRTYNGFVFEKQDDLWMTTIRLQDKFQGWTRDYEILFHYTPEEVEHIESMKNSRNESTTPNLFLDAKTVYITMDPEYPSEVVLSGVEIAKIIGRVYQKEAKGAINRPYNNSSVQVVTCNDLAPLVRVIQLELGNSTRIYSKKGCLIVEGTNPETLLKAAERLAFEMLKIL